MPGLTPKIPLTLSSTDGLYTLTKNFRENTKQSLKMIVLTSPGERIMDPLFGVGARQFLFEQFSVNMYRSFQAKLIKQITKYLPIIDIVEVNFLNTNKEAIVNSAAEAHVLSIEIKYTITNLNISDSLFIEDISIGS